MKYTLIKEETVFDDFFKLKKATIKHELFNGGEMTIDRLSFERGDGVAALIYEHDTDSFLFTKQFRYPTINQGDGWLLEIAAGCLEDGEEPVHRMKIEIEEETGYRASNIEFINSWFASPGGTSERIFLYYAEVSSRDKISLGGGVLEENEDIQLVKMTREDTLSAYKANNFRDAKTIMAIQWFMLNKSK